MFVFPYLLVVPFSWKKRCPQDEHSVKLNKQNPSVGLTKTVVPFHTTFFQEFHLNGINYSEHVSKLTIMNLPLLVMIAEYPAVGL